MKQTRNGDMGCSFAENYWWIFNTNEFSELELCQAPLIIVYVWDVPLPLSQAQQGLNSGHFLKMTYASPLNSY